MDKSLRLSLKKLMFYGLIADTVVLLMFYFSFDIEFRYLIAIIGVVFLAQNIVIWSRFNHNDLSVKNGTVFWQGHPCDIEVERFIYDHTLKLSYMNGPHLKSVRVPRNALSSNDWYWLTEYRT